MSFSFYFLPKIRILQQIEKSSIFSFFIINLALD